MKVIIEGVEYVPKEPQVIPSGIEEFMNANGHDTISHVRPKDYYNWVRLYFGLYRINKIRVQGVPWTVGEKVGYSDGRSNEPFTIQGFEYKDGWQVFYDSKNSMPLYQIAKYFNQPLATLQGHVLYNNELYYYVDGYWTVHEVNAGFSCGFTDPLKSYINRCFVSRLLADQFIYKNKPYYPKEMVDELVKQVGLYKDYPDKPVEEALNKIIIFK